VRRVVRAARALGISPVGVAAAGDEDQPWVRDLDAAIRLDGARPSESYLDASALVEAACELGADAVHPGYGFLSERADFARAVLAAGLTWVGPPPDAIEAMGDKLAAKARVAAAGVPVLPTWSPGDRDVVLPVLVKAAAGGGGKGMRLVEDRTALQEAVASARREAESAFGDGTVFLEPYVRRARHVEVQVVGDQHGTLVHAFERECSIQRRHQKILEEAPSPALDPELRARMGEAALAAARAVGYWSLGTVEFVLDASGQFWFLEMNTRLQVEHPVTESILGIDLVREQLRIADGEPLTFTQRDLEIRGHAIEARVYAEDPGDGFLPQSGTLLEWSVPDEVGVRVDDGVEAGTRIGIEFDPLLAKVIAHAPTRPEAARILASALARSRIHGVRTNRDLLVAILQHPRFLEGLTTTDFLAETGVIKSTLPPEALVREAAIVATLAERAAAHRSLPAPLAALPVGWTNAILPPRQCTFLHRGQPIAISYTNAPDGTVEVGEERFRVHEASAESLRYERIDARGVRCLATATLTVAGERVWVGLRGADVELVHVPLFAEPAPRAVPVGGVEAPMPARVLQVAAAPGDTVGEGELLVVLETMKMEHRIVAPAPSRVLEVRVGPGDQVERGQILVVCEELR